MKVSGKTRTRRHSGCTTHVFEIREGHVFFLFFFFSLVCLTFTGELHTNVWPSNEKEQ